MLHNCSLELPPTITMSSFNRDLDYYGLVPEEGAIKHACIGDVLASLQTGKSKYDMFCLAVETHHQYVFKKSLKKCANVSLIDAMKNLGRQDTTLIGEERKMFFNYLGIYFGLRLATNKDDPSIYLHNNNVPDSFYVMKK